MVYLCFMVYFISFCLFTVSASRLLFQFSPFVHHGRNPCRFVTAYEGEKIMTKCSFLCELYFFFLITTDGTWSNLLHGRLGSVDNTGYSLRVHIVVGEIFWVCFGACLWQYEPKPVAHISRGLSLRGKRRIFNHWYSLRYLYIFTGAARPGKIICQKKS